MKKNRVSKMEIESVFVEDFFGYLPEGFIAKALSLTSPRDACRLSLVCSLFRSAAEWDVVWESFLPEDYRNIVLAAADGGCSSSYSTKKQLYLCLCDRPIIIDGGNKSFSLDKRTGKKCYMLAARDLFIVWSDTPHYWRWISLPESRFSEVAELIRVCWLEVYGRIKTSMLSPDTVYAAFIVFKSTSEIYGFESQPAEVSIGISGVEIQTQTVFLEPEGEPRRLYPVLPGRRIGMFNRCHVVNPNLILPVNPNSKGNGPRQREDGWMEIEVGQYYIKKGEEGVLKMSMTEVKGGNWKGGLVIQGIEIRPMPCKS
ncbi:putative F-box protein PP2-B12 [Rutidosis leptorrhynchoides]|uniref:putative F-box protein PP2-B12 n=1 Tax=Rutidosis leptorrhynchoides TaxID=125765 RepID=UPI003A99AFD7